MKVNAKFDLLTFCVSKVSNGQDGGADSQSGCVGSDCGDHHREPRQQCPRQPHNHAIRATQLRNQ